MPVTIDDKKMWEDFKTSRLKEADAQLDAAAKRYKAGEVTKDQLIQEGIWDRMKARGAGLKAGVQSAPQRLKGAAQSALGKAAGAVGGGDTAQALQQQGQDTASAAKNAAFDPKALSIINSYIGKLQKTVTSFNNDLKQLGIDPKGELLQTNPDAAKAINGLASAINELVGNIQSSGTRGQAYGALQQNVAPAPAPAPVAGAPAPAPATA